MKLDELQMQVGSALQEAGRLSATQLVYREYQHGHERAPCIGHGCLALTAQLGRVVCASTETIQMAVTTNRGRRLKPKNGRTLAIASRALGGGGRGDGGKVSSI